MGERNEEHIVLIRCFPRHCYPIPIPIPIPSFSLYTPPLTTSNLLLLLLFQLLSPLPPPRHSMPNLTESFDETNKAKAHALSPTHTGPGANGGKKVKESVLGRSTYFNSLVKPVRTPASSPLLPSFFFFSSFLSFFPFLPFIGSSSNISLTTSYPPP